MAGKAADLIKTRFNEELDHIQEYLFYLRHKSNLSQYDVKEMDRMLSHFNVRPVIRSQLSDGYYLSPADILAILQYVSETEREIDRLHARYENEIGSCSKANFEAVPDNCKPIFDETVRYAAAYLPMDFTDRHLENMIDHASEQIPADLNISPAEVRSLYQEAAKEARRCHLHGMENEIGMALVVLADIKMLSKTSDPANSINTFRQGFILVMTVFDAAMFDLTRLVLQKDFFRFVAHLDPKEKKSLADFGNAGSFETLRDEIIDEQLKRRYLKDVIHLLIKAGIALHARASDTDLLKEVVQRRNVHIHNRGTIDQAYLDHGNPSNLALGAVAAIDQPYWEKTLHLTHEAVERLAALA